MKITEYILRYKEHTEGEDCLYRDVEWTSTYDCPVKDLKPSKYVPFKPDKHLSEPGINCISVTDDEVVLEYSGYTGTGSQGLETHRITLNESDRCWSCFFGGGKYSTSRYIKLLNPQEIENHEKKE